MNSLSVFASVVFALEILASAHVCVGQHQAVVQLKRSASPNTEVWNELLTHAAHLDDIWARYEWLAHEHDVMNASMDAVSEALRRFDVSLTQIVEVQRRQDHEILALQHRPTRPALKIDHQPNPAHLLLVKTGASSAREDGVQQDAPMTSECCDERRLEERVERLTSAKIKSSLVFLRVLGDGVASLNTTVTSLAAKLSEQVEYLNVLAVEMETMKDSFYRNRRRLRALTSREESLEEKLGRLLSLEARLDRIEEALSLSGVNYGE